MPTISVFYGIAIQMFWREHAPPHFHAIYGEQEAIVGIETWEILRGSLSGRAYSLVKEWAAAHRDELMEDWDLCQQKRTPRKIQPLE